MALEPEVMTADQAEQQALEYIGSESPQAVALRVKAQTLSIVRDDQYTQAAFDGRSVSEALRKAETERKKLKEPILEAGRRVDSLFQRLMEPLKMAKDMISTAMQVYDQKKEAERRKLEAEAREKASAEQRRLDALALANAERAEKAGHHEKAEEVLANVPVVPVPVIAPLTPEVKGTYSVTRWKARLATHIQGTPITPEAAIKLLAGAVANGQAATNLLLLNEVAANKLAGALQKEMKIPGIEAYAVENRTFK